MPCSLAWGSPQSRGILQPRTRGTPKPRATSVEAPWSRCDLIPVSTAGWTGNFVYYRLAWIEILNHATARIEIGNWNQGIHRNKIFMYLNLSNFNVTPLCLLLMLQLELPSFLLKYFISFLWHTENWRMSWLVPDNAFPDYIWVDTYLTFHHYHWSCVGRSGTTIFILYWQVGIDWLEQCDACHYRSKLC